MKTQVFVNRAMSIMMPALMLVMNCITVLIVWIGGHNANEGIMQVGDVMAFIQYTMQIVMAFLMISHTKTRPGESLDNDRKHQHSLHKDCKREQAVTLL